MTGEVQGPATHPRLSATRSEFFLRQCGVLSSCAEHARSVRQANLMTWKSFTKGDLLGVHLAVNIFVGTMLGLSSPQSPGLAMIWQVGCSGTPTALATAPYRARFTRAKDVIVALLSAPVAEFPKIVGHHNTSLRAAIREIPPVFRHFWADSFAADPLVDSAR